jgi:hypothetical protein
MDKRIIVLILIVFVALIGGMIYLKKKRDAKAKAKAKAKAEARAAAMREEAKEAEEKATREAKERAAKEAEEERMRKAKEENDRAEAEAASKLKQAAAQRQRQQQAAAAQRRPPRRAIKQPKPVRPPRRKFMLKHRRRDPSGCGSSRSIRASRCRHRYNSNLRAARYQAKQQGRRVCFGNVCANPPDPKTVERQRQQQAAAAERRRQQQEAQRRHQQQEAERKRAANASFDASDANSTQEKSTKPNHWGGGNSIYLDRHNVDCGNKALKGFHLRRPRGNQINYNYQCGGTTSGASINKNSGTNNWGGGHTLYLDRHKVDCGPNPLHQFKLTRPNRSSVRYDYKCGDSRHAGRCRRANTGFNQGHRMSIFLDRHKIRCRNDEVLKSFKLNRQPRTGWPGKMRYDYECCKI